MPIFFDKQTTLLKKYMLIFPDYNMDRADAIIMLATEIPPKNLSIMIDRTVLDYSEPENIDNFLNDSSELLGTITKELSIHNLIRFGMRANWLQEMPMQKATSVVMSKINLSDPLGLGEVQAAEISVKYMNKISNQGVNIRAGVGKVQTLSYRDQVADAKNYEGLIADIDLYSENTSPKQNDFIYSAKSFFFKILNSLEESN